MNLVSIDPGARSVAWAYFTKGMLTGCGLTRGELMHSELFKMFDSLKNNDVVIEIPRVYPQRSWKGDPNDLISVALTAGACGAYLRQCDVHYIKPHEWKGSRSKKADNAQTLKRLDAKEKKLFDSVDVPKSLRHNVIDAIGIGLWRLKRR